MEDLKVYMDQILSGIEKTDSEQGLEQIRIENLGRKGRFTTFMKELGKLDPEERKMYGAQLNQAKQILLEAFDQRKHQFQNQALENALNQEKLDMSLTVKPEISGRLHPVTKVMETAIEIFSIMGFKIAEGPDIEDDFHNFTALNFPEEHPARDVLDTFFLKSLHDRENKEEIKPYLLRTHTSPVQIRVMETSPPPIRIIVPGRTYRCDSDQTHTPMFHQLEGLVIDQKTHMGHLKFCLETFLSLFFNTKIKNRFRPHYFPFTEPSAEVDIAYHTSGDEIIVGQGSQWMEILGCGMVHPNVIRNCNLDPDLYQGFAFGMGLDRLAMLKYGISDLRSFFNSDIRWLKHYGFSPFSF